MGCVLSLIRRRGSDRRSQHDVNMSLRQTVAPNALGFFGLHSAMFSLTSRCWELWEKLRWPFKRVFEKPSAAGMLLLRLQGCIHAVF